MSGAGIGVVGAAGRLGRALLAECERQARLVTLQADRTGWRQSASPDVLIDASGPDAAQASVAYCGDYRIPLIYAVSAGFPGRSELLAGLADAVPVVIATNLSRGHWVQLALLRWLAEFVGDRPGEVFERHPVTKRDAPSASALELAAAWTSLGGRTDTEIEVERAGEPVSDHVVTVRLPGEILQLGHAVFDLRAAATGALLAVDFARTVGAGSYSMADVFGRIAVTAQHD